MYKLILQLEFFSYKNILIMVIRFNWQINATNKKLENTEFCYRVKDVAIKQHLTYFTSEKNTH